MDEINARIKEIKIGSSFHDGRGFATVMLEGAGWGQGFSLSMEPRVVDGLIYAAGATDLFSCIGKFVRIKRQDGFITEVGHIIDKRWVWVGK